MADEERKQTEYVVLNGVGCAVVPVVRLGKPEIGQAPFVLGESLTPEQVKALFDEGDGDVELARWAAPSPKAAAELAAAELESGGANVGPTWAATPARGFVFGQPEPTVKFRW